MADLDEFCRHLDLRGNVVLASLMEEKPHDISFGGIGGMFRAPWALRIKRSGVDVSCSRYPYVQSLVGKWWNLVINYSFTKPSNKP